MVDLEDCHWMLVIWMVSLLEADPYQEQSVQVGPYEEQSVKELHQESVLALKDCHWILESWKVPPPVMDFLHSPDLKCSWILE